MARPLKFNADYFSHDSDMRNDARVKAVRRKFGVEGYGIYCMTVEYLADQHHFMTDMDDLSIELMAGDFDIDPTRLKEAIDYCISIDLFQDDNGSLRCKSLEKRLEPLLSKRKPHETDSFRSGNTHKESKVKESKEKESLFIEHGATHDNYVIVASTMNTPAIRINGKDGLSDYMQSNKSVLNNSRMADKFMMARRGKKFNDFMHLWNDYNLWTEKQFK